MHVQNGKQHPSQPKDAFLPISFGTEEILFCSSLSHTLHKHEVNQHVSISVWFSRVSLFFPFKVNIWQRHDLIFCYGAFNDFSETPQLSEHAKIWVHFTLSGLYPAFNLCARGLQPEIFLNLCFILTNRESLMYNVKQKDACV